MDDDAGGLPIMGAARGRACGCAARLLLVACFIIVRRRGGAVVTAPPALASINQRDKPAV